MSVVSRRALALAMFSGTLPSLGENCRHAICICVFLKDFEGLWMILFEWVVGIRKAASIN